MECYPEEEFLKADGFDDAIIGVNYLNDPPQLIYSVAKCLQILEEEMDSEEAIEYFEYNVAGSYMGPNTPIWSWDFF